MFTKINYRWRCRSTYADITESQSYIINVTLGDLSSTNSYLGGAKVFIDFNIDGDFNDPGEDIGIIPVQTSAGITVPLSFIVPTTGVYGPTRMRVVCQSVYDFTTPNDIGPCESPVVGSWVNPWFGATEDYSIVLNNPNVNATYLWNICIYVYILYTYMLYILSEFIYFFRCMSKSRSFAE